MAQDVLTDLTQGPQHRHHGAHRCRQDDDDRAHPVLHGNQPQDRRDARWRLDDRLDGAGAGAWHHDHVCRRDLLLGQEPDQHHRHPRPRRLHGRGGALAPRPRRRRRRLRRQGGRRAPVRDRLASGRQVQRPAHLLRQQDGQARRRLLLHGRHDHQQLKAKPLVIQLPIGAENDFVGVVDLVEMRALVWAGDSKGDVTMGAKYEIQEIPADMAKVVAKYREHAARDRRRDRRGASREVLRWRGAHGRRDQGRDPQADRQLGDLPRAVRLGVQEPRRAADARRGRRLPAVAAGRAGHRGARPEERRDGHRASLRSRRARSRRSRSRS